MSLVAPKLDDRRFDDLVAEAIQRIPHYCKEWTDHNDSDPGVTLIELFAWMTDLLLYRLNQVPDLHYIRFLQMLGIKLREPIAAQVPVTFWLAGPQPTAVTIPEGTEVASTQTETESSIIFTTTENFIIMPPELRMILRHARDEKKTYEEVNLKRLEVGFEGVDLFLPVPKVDDAFYFGFENDLSHHLLGFEAEFDPAYGAGVDPTQPPYVWEAASGDPQQPWIPCEPDIDTTRSMNGMGMIRIHLPKLGKHSLAGSERYWVRVRIKEITPQERARGMRPFVKSPRMQKCLIASWGGTLPAVHARRIQREFLGRSDGSPGQRFHLQSTPILKRDAGERLVVQSEDEPAQAWIEVADFSDSGAHDHHYTLDSVSGELRLGPAIRQQDGTIKLYGEIPPRGSNLIFDCYRYGGGQEGNVQAGILNTLKTSIPYVDRVMNRQAASGGLDAETLEAAMQRAPSLLRSRDRAITESDFEYLARQALPAGIGRVKCLQVPGATTGKMAPGQVYVLVIPRLTRPETQLDPRQLELRPDDVATLSAYLDERRLLTTHIDIRAPAYHWTAVKVKLQAAPEADRAKVEAEVLRRLYRYLNPLTGGTNQDGWPFGRDLFLSDVYQCLQGIPDVLFVRSVDMHNAKPGGEAQSTPVERIEVLRHGVIASGKHQVEFIKA